MNKRLVYFMFIFIGITFYFIPNVVKAETFDGEYSIEYLLKNYSVVTLGQKNTDIIRKIKTVLHYRNKDMELNKGDLRNFTNVKGAILVNGDYMSGNSSVFGIEAGNTKSFIKGTKGDNVSTQSQLISDPNYVDFNKMYKQIVIESKQLADNTQYHINDSKVEITQPGIYTVNSMPTHRSTEEYNNWSSYWYYNFSNEILIKNYDKNSKYVFNYYNEYVEFLPSIMIMESGSNSVISLVDYIQNGQYNGNVIFNFPNAKTLFNTGNNIAGTIIAPNATMILGPNIYWTSDNNTNYYYSTVYGNVIANAIANFYTELDGGIYYYVNTIEPTYYKINKELVEQKVNYCKEAVDYQDDEYIRDYSISDLLQNYNLVTLGHKSIDTKAKLLQFGNTPGSIKLFHISGPVLIAGDLYSKVYEDEIDDYYTFTTDNYSNKLSKFDRINFDLESNKVNESYIAGNILVKTKYTHISKDAFGNDNTYIDNVDAPITVIQPWDNMSHDNYWYYGRTNNLNTKTSNYAFGFAGSGNISNYFDNYINFDRLYNNVVAEQKGIEEGDKIKASNGVAHIPIGGNYVIDDISDINKIVFDNFEENKDVITIVTIKNSGDINFPEINKDKGYYKGIVTNDYYGKKQATHLYERDTFVTEDGYYGNIIFNVPNATYIKLKENVPFAGHLIAPNADVETEETHFAGCFIVNSIYGEGNTEAHFYPLTAYDNCECSVGDQVSESLQARFNELRLSRLLGGEKSIVETNIVGDQAQYKKDTDQLNQIIDNCPMRKHYSSSLSEILKNPPTYGTIGAVLLIIIGLIIGLGIYKKKKAV